MTYRTYEEYKNSGVKWIGKIPIEWDIIKAKFCFNISHGHYFKSEDFVNEGINLIRIGDISDGVIKLDNCVKLPIEYSSLFKEYLVKPNDLLIALTGATIGKIGYVPKTSELMLLNYRVGKINCDNPNYYKYLLNSHFIQTQIKLISEGSAQENIGNKDFDELIVLDIGGSTKHNISYYLNKKTAEIDNNISKNKELISLLEEKKVALINQCVTKGLNPNVPMKDSGIEWIGEIPEQWESHRIKDFLTFKIGGTPSTSNESYFEGDNIWVSIADLNSNKGEIISDSSTKISEEGIKFSNVKKISKGSLLYSFKLSVGLTAFAGCDLYTNEAIASFEPNDYVDLNFLKYVFKVGFENNAFENIYGAKLFNSDLIKFAKFVLPKCMDEQKEIANYLDINLSKMDNIINKVQSQIDLLEEYKQSLIYHVVTGKVDVREVEV